MREKSRIEDEEYKSDVDTQLFSGDLPVGIDQEQPEQLISYYELPTFKAKSLRQIYQAFEIRNNSESLNRL